MLDGNVPWIQLLGSNMTSEERLEEVKRIVDEAEYAMIGGNLDNRPVPIWIIQSWLSSIRAVAQHRLQPTNAPTVKPASTKPDGGIMAKYNANFYPLDKL